MKEVKIILGKDKNYSEYKDLYTFIYSEERKSFETLSKSFTDGTKQEEWITYIGNEDTNWEKDKDYLISGLIETMEEHFQYVILKESKKQGEENER